VAGLALNLVMPIDVDFLFKYNMINILLFLFYNFTVLENIVVRPSSIDLGEVKYYGFYKYKFKVFNNTNYIIRIKNVNGDCGCLSFEYKNSNILPRTSEYIYATQKIIDSVDFNKNVIIYTSSNTKPFILLEVRGRVIK